MRALLKAFQFGLSLSLSSVVILFLVTEVFANGSSGAF